MALDLKNYKKIFVACCEAGAGQIVSSFILRNGLKAKCLFSLDGPAKRIFERKLGQMVISGLEGIATLDPATDVVITGRSLIPELERDAIRIAHGAGIRVVTFVDHWVNFEEAFIPLDRRSQALDDREFMNYLPDEIVVGDAYALEAIKKTRIPREITSFHENDYFKDLKEFFLLNKNEDVRSVLYLSEPVYDDIARIYGDGNFLGYNEYDILSAVLGAASVMRKKGFCELVIRLHPNEDKAKYAGYLSSDTDGLKIKLSSRIMLESDIAGSSWVIAVESMGLVAALLAGKTAISYLPKKARNRCRLPHEELIKIDDVAMLEGIPS